MKTLKEQYPDTHRILIENGYEGIPMLMEKCHTGSSMDRLLGTNGATSNWMLQKNLPNQPIEKKAKSVVTELMAMHEKDKQAGLPLQEPEMLEKKYDVDPRAWVEPSRSYSGPVNSCDTRAVLVESTNEIVRAEEDVDIILVFVPKNKRGKVERVITLMGCVIEEV